MGMQDEWMDECGIISIVKNQFPLLGNFLSYMNNKLTD